MALKFDGSFRLPKKHFLKHSENMFLNGRAKSNLLQCGGGGIMARIDFRPYKCTKLPLGAQNWFPNKYYDLWLSIDTKSSPLCGILLRLRAVKWRWSKMKIFKRKKVKISNFGLQKCYIPQKKAENIYNKDSTRKSNISYKKKIRIFSIFSFFT